MGNPLDKKVVKACKLCPELGKRHCPSEGSLAASLMIVGQSPGSLEVRKGRPFCGPSGDLVDFMLDEAGISREDTYIANALKCQPPDNRPGKVSEIKTCYKQWLKGELKTVDPEVVLILGKDAHKALIGKRTEFKHMGELHSKKRVYLMSYHPAFFLRRHDIEGFLSVGRRIMDLTNDE